MSMTYCAGAVLGCKIPRSELFIEEQVRACLCDVDDRGRFCSNCGHRLWKTKKTPIPQYDQHNEMLCDFEVIDSRYYDYIYVCAAVAKTDMHSNPEIMNDGLDKVITGSQISLLKRQLRNKLNPLGLWDNDAFGIWVVQWTV